jgi:parallel beta-helix repeat protein
MVVVLIVANLLPMSMIDNENQKQTLVEDIDNKPLRKSALTPPLLINNNWSAVKSAGFCTGGGNYSSPYIIENKVIDATGSIYGIDIVNSMAIFIIRNVTIYNAIWGRGGISIGAASNGTLINNTIYNNEAIGIRLSSLSSNISIIDNKIYNNPLGINFDDAHNSTIYNNTIWNNSGNGIELEANSNNNKIINNTLFNNTNNEISSDESYSNLISNNTITNVNLGGRGIALSGSYFHNLTNNLLYGAGIALSGTSVSEVNSHKIDNSNKVNTKQVYYYINKTSLNTSNFTNAGQIILVNTNNSLITNQLIFNTTSAITTVYCKNNTIQGNTLYYNYYGIDMAESRNNSITDNTLDNNIYGMKISKTNNTYILRNNLSDNQIISISLESSNNCTLANNTVTNNIAGGIVINAGMYHNFTNNQVYNSGFVMQIMTNEYKTMNLDTSNKVNNKPVYFFYDTTYLRANNYSNAGQLILFNVNDSIIEDLVMSNISVAVAILMGYNNTITKNTFTNITTAVSLIYGTLNNIDGNTALNCSMPIVSSASTNTSIKSNLILNSSVGITLYWDVWSSAFNNTIKYAGVSGIMLGAINCTLKSNNISYSSSYGIIIQYAQGSSVSKNILFKNGKSGISFLGSTLNDNNTFSENIIKDNVQYGVEISNSYAEDNLFFNNSFVANGIHALDSYSNNFWNNSMIGNYWDNYSGPDSDKNGIGDVSYSFTGGTDFFPIVDRNSPIIVINSPQTTDLSDVSAPLFNVEITENSSNTMWYPTSVDSMWYSIDGGIINLTFSGNTTINQTEWVKLSTGAVTINFYANDSEGNIGNASVTFQKDITAPDITILKPILDDEQGETPPIYQITITETNLDINNIWYSVDGVATKYYITVFTGSLNKALWDSLPKGTVTIRFYAIDLAGNQDMNFTIITKTVDAVVQPTPPGIPGYDLLIFMSIIVLFSLVVIKKKFKTK